MRNWGSRTATPQAGDHSANYGLVFPPLSGDKPTKRQMREASLASVPLDISSSYETVNQEDRNLSSAERVENNLSSATDDATPGISTVETEPQEQNFQSAQTGTQEHNLLTPSTVVQTGNIKKDWLPADDAKTCPDLLPTEAQTDVVDRQGRFLSQRKKRVECFTKYYADGGELTEEETTVAQKQDSSSSSVKGTMSATKVEESLQGL